MPVRMAITNQTAMGEQVVVDVCQWNPVTGAILHENTLDMLALARECLILVDERKREMHHRMLDGYGLREYCTPEEWLKISTVLDILAGNVSADTIARRWQSTIEENMELENGRAEVCVDSCNDIARAINNAESD